MELRSLLTSGHSVALSVLALGAVQSGLTLAMAGGDSPPMGWTPMPDPADGGVGSPPFPMNLTAEERANLETFDALDFEVFSRQDWSRLGESHAPYIRVHWPDGYYTDGIDKHTEDMAALYVWAPDLRIEAHPLRVAKDRPGLTRWPRGGAARPAGQPPRATAWSSSPPPDRRPATTGRAAEIAGRSRAAAPNRSRPLRPLSS
jgi:hypothetical protein